MPTKLKYHSEVKNKRRFVNLIVTECHISANQICALLHLPKCNQFKPSEQKIKLQNKGRNNTIN